MLHFQLEDILEEPEEEQAEELQETPVKEGKTYEFYSIVSIEWKTQISKIKNKKANYFFFQFLKLKKKKTQKMENSIF